MEQKFEKGGELKKILNNRGVFDSPSHSGGGIPFSFGGRPVEVQEVCRKQKKVWPEQITVTGTPAQVASAANVVGGGKNFNPDAKLIRYEYGGLLGRNLSVPFIPPRVYQTSSSSSSGGGSSDDVIGLLMEQAKAVLMVSSQLLSLQVKPNPYNETKYQNERHEIYKNRHTLRKKGIVTEIVVIDLKKIASGTCLMGYVQASEAEWC